MESSKVLSLLEQLDDEVDDLEESLAPLLKTALSESASKLPLLDKAKLYVLVTYTIESMLFSYLRLNGVKAREHPVFTELTRVKQYLDKIKVVEIPAAERKLAVDKGAASRFIKAGLAGNDKYDLERAERQAKERARALIKFEEASSKIAKKRKVDEIDQTPTEEPGSSDSESSSESSEEEDETTPVIPKKKQKPGNATTLDSGPTSDISSPASSQLTNKERGKLEQLANEKRREKREAKAKGSLVNEPDVPKLKKRKKKKSKVVKTEKKATKKTSS